MPTYADENKAMIIDPQGDIIFAWGNPAPDDDRPELLIIDAHENRGRSNLAPDFAGKSTAEVDTKVRIKLDTAAAIALLEQLTGVLVHCQGMPVLDPSRDAFTCPYCDVPVKASEEQVRKAFVADVTAHMREGG